VLVWHLTKILKAEDLIGRREGASIDELAQHLEVNKRTAYRLILTMDEMEFPFFEEVVIGWCRQHTDCNQGDWGKFRTNECT